jgi:serine/threonine-protein kinase RsbW
MTDLPNVRLNLSSRPENVLLMRQTLSGVAEVVGLDGVTLNDLATAVTEACNNVAMHAYEGEEGPLEVEVFAMDDLIEVAVRDRGIGIRKPLGSAQEASSGIGISIIHALAHHVEFSDGVKGGTEVRMEFATPGTRWLKTSTEDEFELPAPEPSEPPTTMWVTIAPTQLARTVLPRLLGVLAARAHISTDRLADAALLAEELIGDLGSSEMLALRLNDAR